MASPMYIATPSHSMTLSPRKFNKSAGGVSTVSKDCLSCDPSALGAQETHNRGNVLDLGESAAHALALVELDRLGRLLRIEEG
jgi:hypothetical protein